MKTRKFLIAVLAIALLAAYYLLGTDYLKQQRDNEALASDITASKVTLAQIPPPPADLEEQLDNARAGLREAQNVLPERLNSTLIIYAVLKLADDAGVTAIPLVTQPWTTESVGGENYSVFRFHLTATGTFNLIADFLNQLENGKIETLIIEYAVFDSITAPFGGEGSDDDANQVNAMLEIAVYSRPPTMDLEEEGSLE